MSVPVRGSWLRRIWQNLGPGLITGGRDNVPSSIATYLQAGKTYQTGDTTIVALAPGFSLQRSEKLR